MSNSNTFNTQNNSTSAASVSSCTNTQFSNYSINVSNSSTTTTSSNNSNFVNNLNSYSGSSNSTCINSNLSNSNNNNNLNFNSNNNQNVILQTLKRRTNKIVVPLDERVTLEKAFGFTITSNTRITQSCDGTVAYLAGCVIVLYDYHRQSQDFIISQARKTLTTVSFSNDGKTLATGESGHDPKVRVWDVRDKIQLCEFGGHKFSIECVCFSTNPNSNLLVSIGSMHDMVVNVWNLKTRFKVASNKIACKVKGIAFSRDGTYFVTVGNRHVKFWYLTISSLMETVPLKGRAAILGDMKNNYFCDVVCGANDDCSQYTYTITTNGILCEFNENRLLSRATDLRSERAYCIYSDIDNLFIGCSSGTILIFKQRNLDFVASLPRPHYLGVDIAKGIDTRHIIENLNNHDLKYPDCVAICYNKNDYILNAIYNDHSFYVWDIRDLSKVKKIDSHLFHSSCCWALDIYSTTSSSIPSSSYSSSSSLPIDSFITCSTDNTLRIWSPVSNSTTPYLNTSNRLKRNIYSKELLKIIYIDNDYSALCDIDQSLDNTDSTSGSNSTTNQSATQSTSSSSSSSSNIVTNLPLSNINNFDSSSNNQGVNLKMGARCLKVNPFGKHLATGDRNGNIRIYDLDTLESVCMIEAHDGEILYLQYSQPESGRLFLASSSRDRLIHIFDASRSTYDLLQTLDDHSAAITAVRFCFNQIEKQLYIISCGADKSIMFRTAMNANETQQNGTNNSNVSSSSQLQFVRTSYVAEKQTFYDLNVDTSRNYINTISQDRMIRTYSLKDGKRLRQFRGSLNEDGYLLKMDTDRNSQLLATSCTDKCVYVWDLNTCECVAYIYGHSEVVTDLKFTSDNQHLITVSGDGCIFVWKLNTLLTNLCSTNNSSIQNANFPTSHSASQLSNSSSFTWSTSRRTNSFTTAGQLQKSHPLQQQTSLPEPPPPISAPPPPFPSILTSPISTQKTTNTLKSQQSLDTIFDNDSDSALPAWARNKLMSSQEAPLTQPHFAIETNTTNQVKAEPTRRSRAVWGPPVLNTSFAIMLESEHSILSNSTMESPVPNFAKFDDGKSDNQTDEDIKKNLTASTDTVVQFPSPCVDKDFFHVKKVKLNKSEIIDSMKNRNSWIDNSSELSSIVDFYEQEIKTTSSEEDIKSPDNHVIDRDDEVKKDTKKIENEDDDIVIIEEEITITSDEKSPSKQQTTTTIKSSCTQPSSTSKSLSNALAVANESFEANPDIMAILRENEESPSKVAETSSNSLIVDSLIKLDCDMDNSIRRQSLSARYLMKTQQLKQNVVNNTSINEESKPETSSPTLKTNNDPLSVSSLSTTSSSTTSTSTTSTNPLTPTKTTNISPNKFESGSYSQFGSAAQMAAELLKVRRKSSIYNLATNQQIQNTNGNQLYSHHTESSFNKTKSRQAGEPGFPMSSTLKRSPSVSSILNNNPLTKDEKNLNGTKNNNNSDLSSSSSSSMKQINKSSSAKSSPTKQNLLTNNNGFNGDPNSSTDSNLKKAISMIALFSNNQQKVKSNSGVKSQQQNGQNNCNSNQNSPITNTNACFNNMNSLNGNSTSLNNLLPPKTVRQVKQRSAERQNTSSSILSATQNQRNNTATTTTFSEQNKHLRKLSNSIQNLQSSALSQNLPPQAPRGSSVKVVPQILMPNSSSKPKINCNKQVKPCQKNEIDQIDPQLDSNPINNTSLTSSSSSSSSCSLSENTNPNTNEKLNDSFKLSELDFKLQAAINSLSPQQQPAQSQSPQQQHNLKKQITFATIVAANAAAAAASNNSAQLDGITHPSTSLLLSLTSNGITNGSCSSSSLPYPKFNNDKIELILNEFKQNILILDFIYNQASKSCDFSQTSSPFSPQSSSLATLNPIQVPPTQQTIHLIQTFNLTISSLIKQFNSVNKNNLNQSPITSPTKNLNNNSSPTLNTSTNNNNNNSETKSADLELA